jgi:hypothetical protein
VQDRDRPGWCGVNLAKHTAHARRSQAGFYVPRSELRKLLPGNHFLPSGQLLRVRQDALFAWSGLCFPTERALLFVSSSVPGFV